MIFKRILQLFNTHRFFINRKIHLVVDNNPIEFYYQLDIFCNKIDKCFAFSTVADFNYTKRNRLIFIENGPCRCGNMLFTDKQESILETIFIIGGREAAETYLKQLGFINEY